MACTWFLTGCMLQTNEKEAEIHFVEEGIHPEENEEAAAEAVHPVEDNGVLKADIQIPACFELPLEGATGLVGAASLPLYANASESAAVLRTLEAGNMFYIRKESGSYWQVCILDGTVGWLKSNYCMINLPDVLPSIVYENPNVTASLFRTLGQELDGVTGCKLYEGYYYNPRLGRDEYVMPLNYVMAKKVGAAQQAALQEGNCLKIIETFRPREVQTQVKDALYAKAAEDPDVRAALNTSPWSIGWFIATSLSNHQRGVAMDVTLVRVTDSQTQDIAGCPFVRVSGEEYEMPSAMHELSSAAACLTKPVSSTSKTAWKSAEATDTMTDGARLLQKYCTDAGLTPLASEWWHFNDLDAQNLVSHTSGNGEFWLEGCVSWRMFEE
jgi:D-alanyl-D-alanine dipeptidase